MPSSLRCYSWLGLSVILPLTGVSCQKKAEIQAQTTECAAKVTELTGVIRGLEAEIARVNLGEYNNPSKQQIDDLEHRIPLIRPETARLKEKVEEKKKAVELAEKELNEYRDKYNSY